MQKSYKVSQGFTKFYKFYKNTKIDNILQIPTKHHKILTKFYSFFTKLYIYLLLYVLILTQRERERERRAKRRFACPAAHAYAGTYKRTMPHETPARLTCRRRAKGGTPCDSEYRSGASAQLEYASCT